jgi:hypothetical protein
MTRSIILTVSERVGSNPNYRNSASVLFEAIPLHVEEVVLDFSGVEFISRGFADELHKERLRIQAERNVHVVLEEVSEEVQRMMNTVARTQQAGNRSEFRLPVIRITSANQLENLLLGH